MPRAYSVDLRDRVISAVERDGLTCRQAARRFDVSVSSAIKWVRRYRDTGARTPVGTGGHRCSMVKPERDWILALVAREKELTLAALSARLLAERGVRADAPMLSRFLKSEGISFKKTVLPSEQDRRDVARRRASWKRYQARIDPRRLVFIDETWAKTNMIRTHGWGPRGQRVQGQAPFGHWRTMTFLAALRHDRIDAPYVLDGPSMEPASPPMSSNCSCRRSLRATLSLWTIWGATKARPYARRSARSARISCSCRPTARTSTRSNRSSPNSKLCCERQPNEPWKPLGDASDHSSTHSLHKNAPITSETPDMHQSNHKML